MFFLVILHRLYKKAQDHKDSVKAEIQERNKVTEEISAVTNALQNAASVLLQDADGKAEQLEVGNSSVIVIFRISPGLCWCLNLLQIPLMARSMHIDLKTKNLAQQNMTGPAMALVCVSFLLWGSVSRPRSISRLQRNPQPAAFLLGRAAFSVHPACFPPCIPTQGSFRYCGFDVPNWELTW